MFIILHGHTMKLITGTSILNPRKLVVFPLKTGFFFVPKFR